ncbi:MAG TPA: MBL fold metallo-hydrolase [Cytophagaceae bacterium]|jgi:L-ascorbate metabolism protein UlaG (beta-lactamase superfamily)|nr:MBL fold metallo-hydrolase [Cytophagaceae bacterium]
MKILKRIMIITLLVIGVLTLAVYFFLQTAVFGKRPEGARLERIKKSPNYIDGVFQYPENTPLMTKEASYLKMIQLQFVKDEAREPIVPLPSVKTDLKKPPVSNFVITWFGHSSYLIQLNGKNILVDPVFGKAASPVEFIGAKRFPGTEIYTLEDMPPLDVVIFSHDHYDHLDYEVVSKLNSSAAKLYMPLGVGAHLESWGIDTGKITELDWWEKVEIAPGFVLTSTPARHFSGRGLTDRGKTLWTSYVLQTDSAKLYIGGDSGYGPHFKEIGEKYGPFDITILECGQYHPYWPLIHMTPEETVQAHLDLKGNVLFPVHWGKFALAFHPWREPIERLLAEATKKSVNVTTPLIGEQILPGSNLPESKWWR